MQTEQILAAIRQAMDNMYDHYEGRLYAVNDVNIEKAHDMLGRLADELESEICRERRDHNAVKHHSRSINDALRTYAERTAADPTYSMSLDDFSDLAEHSAKIEAIQNAR